MKVGVIEHPSGEVRFALAGEATEFRVREMFNKEPDTIAWIEKMDPGDVLVDVGANVGMYSVWAAKTRGVRVFAFEPESQNFAMLNVNIKINEADVMAYPLAISDKSGLGPLYLAQFLPGGSCHAFGECVGFKGTPLRSVYTQGSYAVTLDELVEEGHVPAPAFIKVDVDGIEHKVVEGARKAIALARSVLIEINTNREDHNEIFDAMKGLGFTLDVATADKARRTEGAFRGVGNCIFRR